MRASYTRYILHFKKPSGTSRGVLTEKETWFLVLEEDGNTGIGECGILRSLSVDDRPDYEQKLMWVCENIEREPREIWEYLREFPSIQFGVEMALRSLRSQNSFELFKSDFTQGKTGIPINGLVWMGSPEFMKTQIQQKIRDGFRCIKLKIGAIDFASELELLQDVRREFSADDIEIRVDANGAFSPSEALGKLEKLNRLDLHSVEQPVQQGQWEVMAELCEKSPLPIALDEELIGIADVTKKRKLLQTIQPQYLIFKPSLIGGFRGVQEWIQVAAEEKVDWWITSALESNVGLNAIAQFTHELDVTMPQGLGTGGLYTNNFDSPLEVAGGQLWYRPKEEWNFNLE